jgi:fibronectin-binding autotransporter adhesin
MKSPFLACAAALTASQCMSAADLFWNPSPLSDSWENTVWASTPGGTPALAWTSGDNAIFDRDGVYTVTLGAAQSANALDIRDGDVTLAGLLVSSNTINISTGASLTAAANSYLKSGTTALTVNGTLVQTAGGASTQRVSIAGGVGSIQLSGSLRTSGNFNFAGNISGAGGILTDAGGIFTLQGNNTYSGDSLFRNGNTIRLGSADGISPNSLLRFGGGTNIVELTAVDFSRTVGSSAGQVRFHGSADGAGNSGFAAVNAERGVALNGTVQWGAGLFNPGVFHLGSAASTHKVTLTTGLDLNAANRTINSTNGPAEIEAEISGAITGAAGSVLTKTGTGILVLSNSNSHAGGTVIAGSQGAVNPLRISNAGALGSGALTIGSGGNNDQSRLELAGGITVPNSIAAPTVRSTADHPHILNVSGTNTLAANISTSSGGSNFNLRSDSGRLVLGGGISTRLLNLSGDGDGEIQGTLTIASTYGISKTGNGTWTLNSGNLNDTIATVSAGSLYVNGTLSNANVSVQSGATIGGAGGISGALSVASGGILAPGGSIGTFSAGSADLGGTWLVDYGTASIDLLEVAGALNLNGVSLSFNQVSGLLDGTSSYVFANYGSLSGAFTAAAPAGYLVDPAFNGGSSMALVPVPEPAAALLGSLGLLALLHRRR